MQNFGQEKQNPEDDDYSFTPLSATCFNISACGIRDRDLALLIERLKYQVHVCQLNNLEVSPDWIERIERSVERAFEIWGSAHMERESIQDFVVDLAEYGMSDGFDAIRLNDKQLSIFPQGQSNSADSGRVIGKLTDLVDKLVCDGSPEAHRVRERLYDDLFSLHDNDRTSAVQPPGQFQISPLSSVIDSVVVNQLLRDFNVFRAGVMNAPERVHTLTVSAAQISDAREELALLSLKEEKGLHLLAGLLCHRYLGDQVTIEAQVFLKNNAHNEADKSVVYKQLLSRCELFTRSDIEIAESISGKPADLLGASIIEYRSLDSEPGDVVYAVRSRLKSWGSLIDKVTERMFEGNTITDLSGIAIIVDSEDDVRRVYEQLVRLQWSDAELKNVGLTAKESIRGLEIFKTSDKLGFDYINWRGIKVAGFWGDQCVEIQIKTLDFLRREQACNTPESHSSYRRDREIRREENARNDPMYNFSRQFIKYALLGGEPPVDMPANVRLELIPS